MQYQMSQELARRLSRRNCNFASWNFLKIWPTRRYGSLWPSNRRYRRSTSQTTIGSKADSIAANIEEGTMVDETLKRIVPRRSRCSHEVRQLLKLKAVEDTQNDEHTAQVLAYLRAANRQNTECD